MHDLSAEFAAGNKKVEALLRGTLSFKRAMKPAEIAIVGCIDEGVESAAVRAAGSLILLPEEQAIAIIKKLVKPLVIKFIGYHGSAEDGGCGAAAKYLRDIEEIPEPSLNQTIKAARQWAKRIASRTGLKAKEMKLDRGHHHVARAVYFDGTGRMTCTDGLPRGFIISRLYLPHAYAISEVVMAVEIAMNHGFGTLFTDNDPLVLAAVGRNQDQADELREELEHSISQLTEHERSVVRVISVVA